MAKNSVSSVFVNHLGLVRTRADGEGVLQVIAYGLNNASFRESNPEPLIESNDKYLEVLSNFKKQKIQIEIFTEDMDEWFNFGDIIPFIRPVESGYPG